MTHTCKWKLQVERLFDGEVNNADQIREHMATCPACSRHYAFLETSRHWAQEKARLVDDVPEAPFIAALRERLANPAPVKARWFRWWAWASLATAAMIAAFATFLIFFSGERPVSATVVESSSTEIEGGSVQSYTSKDGVTTLWVTVSQDDIW